MKSVYRGFDEERGVEMAWNQVSLSDVLRTPDTVQRMYSEVQLLSTLQHDAIIGFHASWVDVHCRSFNFITELFPSGTLRAYRLRYPHVSLRVVRSWAHQILQGLTYLHAHDPPVIHGDLKCDNLFINGHQGQVKIGDLGLAAMLLHERTAHSVIGTPEFMAPEMYDEEYDQRVDVYSFGMCMLEMITLEFPYAECSNPAQIYKKVTAGKLPNAFYRIKDDDAQRFIGRCLVPASKRPSAAELLLDPFLLNDHHTTSSSPHTMTMSLLPALSNVVGDTTTETSPSSLSDDHRDDKKAPRSDNMTITGKLNAEEDTIFLKVQIADRTGHVRNINFPFDLGSDTTMEVAREMVKELDITNQNPSEIAAMIEQEIGRLLPGREQHEYTYNDDENEEQPSPFYYLSSSPTSSQGSLCGVGPRSSGGFSGPLDGGWSKDHCYYALSDDDDMSSMHSGKYSALHYDTSGHEEEEAQVPEEEQVGGPSSSSKAGQAKTTRFGPGQSSSSRSPRSKAHLQSNKQSLAQQLQRQGSMSPHASRPRRRDDEDDRRGRMSRNRSMVDMRSQLLQRTLVEELNRRLFFNTVGAVENIGFRAPLDYGSSSTTTLGRGRIDHRRRSRDDNNRYSML